jgi:hypothetical protein
MRLTWSVQEHGWAICSVADDHTEAEVTASYIGDAPEQLLRAVAGVARYDTTTQAEFEAEPTVYQWFFHREADTVTIRLVEVPGNTVLWRSRQPVKTLARTVVRAFDTVAHTLGEPDYETRWRRPFPRHELEALRRALKGDDD